MLGAYVYLDKNGPLWDAARPVQTDADGRFIQQAFEGMTYALHAIADSPSGGSVESDNVEVTALKSATPVRLVIKPAR